MLTERYVESRVVICFPSNGRIVYYLLIEFGSYKDTGKIVTNTWYKDSRSDLYFYNMRCGKK